MAESSFPLNADVTSKKSYDIMVIGSLVCDISCTFVKRQGDDTESSPRHGSSNPARISQCVGGVAHNIALAAHYLGQSVLLTSVIGQDAAGDYLLREIEKEGLSTEGIIRLEATEDFEDVRTGQYVGNYDSNKQLIFGMADVRLMLHPQTQNEVAWQALLRTAQPRLIILDTTFSHATIDIITRLAKDAGVPVMLDPVSQPRSEDLPNSMTFKGAPAMSSQHRLDIITPNTQELAALVRGCVRAGLLSWDDVNKKKTSAKEAIAKTGTGLLSLLWPELSATILNATCVLPFVPMMLVTLGSRGCLLVKKRQHKVDGAANPSKEKIILVETAGESYCISIEWLPVVTHLHASEIVSVNGAGDSLVGAFATRLVAASREYNLPLQEFGSETVDAIPLQAWKAMIDFSQWAGVATLQSDQAVSPELKNLHQFISSHSQG